MDFKATILGSYSASPALGKFQTSQVVSIGNSILLVDCGESCQSLLRKYKIKYSKIDYIFISHLHGDHYLGLMGLVSSFHLAQRERPLTIFGPKGLDEIITLHLKYGNLKLCYPLRFEPTIPERKTLILEEPAFQVYSFPLKHRIPCTGFSFEEKPRLRSLIKEKIQFAEMGVEAIQTLRQAKDVVDDDGKIIYRAEEYTHPPAPLRKYAFCSDTIYDEEIIPFIEGADLLYHEATFMSRDISRAEKTFHSTGAQAATLAKAAQVGKLLLGHFSTRYVDLLPLLEEARAIFPESHLSEEGETYCIK